MPALGGVFAVAAVKSAMSAALGSDDDDDSLLKEAAWETTGNLVAPFPLVREIATAARYGSLSGNVPAVSGPYKAIANVVTALEPFNGRLANAQYMRAVGQLMDAAGFAFGVPVMNPLNDLGISEAIGLKRTKR